eukprot:1000939-Rhodomonas_salina.1
MHPAPSTQAGTLEPVCRSARVPIQLAPTRNQSKNGPRREPQSDHLRMSRSVSRCLWVSRWVCVSRSRPLCPQACLRVCLLRVCRLGRTP